MPKKLSVNLERRIATNKWIIKIRWFYMVGILLIGILTKTISQSNVEFSFAAMVTLFVTFAIINIGLYFGQKRIEKNFSKKLLAFISYTQIIIELVFFTIIMHSAGGVESISTVFFFLPVVSASLIFGSYGSIMTAVASGVLVNLLIVAEYYGVISHIPRYGVPTLEFQDLSIALTKTITTSIFYVIVGSFSGYSAKMLLKREQSFEEKTQQLNEQTEKVVIHSKELTAANRELQINIKELSQSKKALINILEDNAKAKREIEEEKNKTLAIIANFTDPIIVLDKNCKISIINPAASRIFGLSGADLGRQVPTDNKFSMSNFKQIIKKDYEIKQISEDAKGQIFIAEEITLKKIPAKEAISGVTYKVITAKVLSLNNQLLGTMKIFYDTTREKAIDRLKSDFISIVAHQLRTPLSAIKWIIKLILDGDAGKLSIEQQELLNKGYLSNERIIRLVNDLLNVSRLEEGKFGFNFEKIDFQDVLSTAISNVEDLAIKNHQELTIKKPAKLPKIFLDKDRMVMVMQNLLSNAIKYTPEYGKIQVIIEVDKQNLHVKINDQGVGIPAEDQPKLFSKFFRAANVIKLETEGTGLGLFLVKNIIEKHNGQVSLKSQEGKGTEIDFYIPINRAPNL